MTQLVLDGVKKELDERNIGGGYNTVRLMDYFEETTNNILSRINKMDPQRGNTQTMTEKEKKRHIFEQLLLMTLAWVLPLDRDMIRLTK